MKRLWKVNATITLVVLAEDGDAKRTAEKSLRCGDIDITDCDPTNPAYSISLPVSIDRGGPLPDGWDERCIPWGEDPSILRQRTIRQIWDEEDEL